MRKILISPIHKTYFSGRLWMGLDLDAIVSALSKQNMIASKVEFSLLNEELDVLKSGTVVFYTTSYNEDYNQYIKDVILNLHISRPDIVLIPNIDLLFSFENKGYQELYKKRLGIENVKGTYFGDVDDFFEKKISLQFPFVLKMLKGSVSSGVHLIRDLSDLNKLATKNKRRGFLDYLRHLKRIKNKDSKHQDLRVSNEIGQNNFDKFFSERMPFVAQEFIPNLEFDYKVLVFGKKYYVLKRFVRNGDFKASGSGKFQWVEAPMQLLDYSLYIFDEMRTPFISLDIFEDNGKYGLIEFQGIGFGPLTLTGAKFYYHKKGNAWEKVEGISNLEEEYANAINWFLENENN